MLISFWDILWFNIMWLDNGQAIELVEYIKIRLASVCGMLGIAYLADRSRHPE